MASLRAGLIGLGMMGRHHGRVLASLEGVDLVGLADPNGDQFGVSGGRPVVQTITELIDLKLDYCVVAVPTAFHEDTAMELAESGVHVLVEKPLAPDSVSSQRIVEAFESRGLVGGVGHIERYNPSLQQARKRISNGDLGEIFQVSTRRQGPFPSRIADVGVVKDLGTHDIDSTSWVTGQEYKSICASTAFRSGREHEDLVAAVGTLADGTVANHLVNWISPLKERTTVITGEKGAFVADTLTADLTFYANGTIETMWEEIAQFRGVTEGDVVRFSYPKPEPLKTEHEQFRDAVLGKEADIVSMRQGLSTVRVADACIQSSLNGTLVPLQSSDEER